MNFYEVFDRVVELLQREGRVSYRVLKRQFALDDDFVEDLKEELIYSKRLAVDEDSRVLVWTGGTEHTPVSDSPVDPISEHPAARVDQPIYTEQQLPAPPIPDAERRQLTVMFCDLADSTRLSGQLDPEDLRDVIRAYQSACADVIERYDGYIAQHLGDGLMVYFGWPQAHEDDAQRAVHAGLGILEAMQGLNSRLEQDKGIRLAVRIGIHTGLVVVGEIGQGTSQEHLALGETPNVASRIEGVAEPGTVTISGATFQLVQGYFVCETLGQYALRGVHEPQPIYHVEGVSGAQNRFEVGLTRELTPLVGRELEIGLLFERWQQVKDGMGQVVLLSGDAGIGKSRLLQVMRDHIANEPHTRLECRSSPYYQNTALYPITDLLQRALRWQQDDTPDQRLAKLEQALSHYRLSLEESVPLFAALLSLSIPEDRYPPLNLSPQRHRQKTLESIVAILLEQAERQPVLFVLEDLHWLDPTSLELLDLLIEQTPTTSVLTLLTCRPTFEPTWSSRSYLTQMTLNRLSGNQIERMAAWIAGEKRLPDEVFQQIVEKTDGVPLYIEEMTKAVLESGVMKDVNGQYELAGSLSSLSIPATLQDSLTARLDRLVTAKAVAQYAAVIGRQFSYELLQIVSQLDAMTLQRELGRLVEAEIVYQRGSPPHATYLFKHALIVDAAYQSLLKSTRQQYHQRIAQALETRFPDVVQTQPELLAHHYTASGSHEKAVRYWRQAGSRSMSKPAYQEAAVCFENALDALQYLPESRDTWEQAIDIRFDLRNVLHPLGASERILDNLRMAERLAESLGDNRRLRQVFSYFGNYFSRAGKSEEAIAAGQRALTLAKASKDVTEQVHPRFILALTYFAMGDHRRAIELNSELIAFCKGQLLHEQFGTVVIISVSTRGMLSLSLAEQGAFAEGILRSDEGVQIAEAANHPGSLVRVLWSMGQLYLRQGNFKQAVQILERDLAFCKTINESLIHTCVESCLGYAYAQLDRIDEALPLLEQAAEESSSTGQNVMYEAIHLTYLSEGYLLANRLDDAMIQAMHALELARIRKGQGDQAWLLRLLGEIAIHRNPPDINQAQIYYQQALDLANELGMRPLQAHCHRGLGKLYSQTGQTEEARAELSTAIEMYRDMEMTFWLPETETALTKVEGKA